MPKIIATINKKTGALTLKTEGITGDACLEATRKLREEMRITAEPEKTDDYYKTENTTNLEQGT